MALRLSLETNTHSNLSVARDSRDSRKKLRTHNEKAGLAGQFVAKKVGNVFARKRQLATGVFASDSSSRRFCNICVAFRNTRRSTIDATSGHRQVLPFPVYSASYCAYTHETNTGRGPRRRDGVRHKLRSGCGVRFEPDTPDLPLPSTATPSPPSLFFPIPSVSVSQPDLPRTHPNLSLFPPIIPVSPFPHSSLFLAPHLPTASHCLLTLLSAPLIHFPFIYSIIPF